MICCYVSADDLVGHQPSYVLCVSVAVLEL